MKSVWSTEINIERIQARKHDASKSFVFGVYLYHMFLVDTTPAFMKNAEE